MATMSKRQQARNERELHDLLRVSGNNKCADCGASNPGWASWNLGIFVCMRCASLHRKLGTHISKVKSLSMDTWTAEQVEQMKKYGNTSVNRIYNPKNRMPDMPLDADEVDSAMERFIRKKYQDMTLNETNTKTQIRNEGSPPVPPKSPIESSPPPPVPSKKSRFFGFGLRASSSAYPLSKHDKKKLPPEPRVESAFTISGDDYASISRMSDARAPISSAELQRKLVQLRDMGFSDTERNTTMLRRLNGDVERTVEALVQLGPSVGQRSSSATVTPQPTGSSRTNFTSAGTNESVKSAPRSSTTSNNPFDQAAQGQGFGLSMASTQKPQSTSQSNNPFDQVTRSQTETGLINSFQGLHVSQPLSQPLFPHSTGGYPVRQPPVMDSRLQSMTPPVPAMSQQYSYVGSPAAVGGNTNPFFQQIPPQATGTNPFFTQPQPQLQAANTGTNPFINTNSLAQQYSSVSSSNPFGLPPSQQSPPGSSQRQIDPPSGQMTGWSQPGHPLPGEHIPTQPFSQQAVSQLHPQTSPQFPNFQHGQPHMQQQWQAPFQSPSPYQMPSNPFASFDQSQMAQQQIQSVPLMPQQTGRYDKNSILALYNHPQLAPSKPQELTSIPEPTNESASPIPGLGNMARRSATMPISMSSMHSAGGSGNPGVNRNPFLQNMSSSQQQSNTGPVPGIMTRHISQDSVNISNLEGGRHSPDAFANLSART